MYKSKRYRVRPLEEVLEDIDLAKQSWYRTTETVFLCDGDAINLPMQSGKAEIVLHSANGYSRGVHPTNGYISDLNTVFTRQTEIY